MKFYRVVRLTLLVLLALLMRPVQVQAKVADPKIQAAIDRGVAYLKANFPASTGQDALTAYALLKAEVPATEPDIAKTIAKVAAKVQDGQYDPGGASEHIYISGLDAMLLVEADPDVYRDQVLAIASYIVSQQGPNGDWDYPDRRDGDTSMAQYAMLGLWAADRIGIAIPPQVLDKAASWLLKTQIADGGFTYHPGTTRGYGNGKQTQQMTAAGGASLLIINMLQYPNGASAPAIMKEKNGDSGKPKSLLEKIDLTTDAAKKNKNSNYVPAIKSAALVTGAKAAANWLGRYFVLDTPYGAARIYYHYSVERFGALADIEAFGGHNWFGNLSKHLLSIQETDGSWKRYPTQKVGTSFAILFLTRSTAKMLNRAPPEETIGGGLLAGGRGLPTDLKSIVQKNGKIVETKAPSGPLNDLLAQLEKLDDIQIEKVQANIVEKIQLGDRKALIGQKDRLKKLLNHPSPEVRRTALWALGRSNDLAMVANIVNALNDVDLTVIIEARNALCFLARKPRGFGNTSDPLADLSDDAPQKDKDLAISKWHKKLVKDWTKWQLKIRPYDERDDLLEQLSAKKK